MYKSYSNEQSDNVSRLKNKKDEEVYMKYTFLFTDLYLSLNK